jgi:hypothetical protein
MGFVFEDHIGPDRFRHALKTHTGRPVIIAVAESGGVEGIVANSPSTMKKSPGLPAGRAENFPVSGELCLPAISAIRQLAVLSASLAEVCVSCSLVDHLP